MIRYISRRCSIDFGKPQPFLPKRKTLFVASMTSSSDGSRSGADCKCVARTFWSVLFDSVILSVPFFLLSKRPDRVDKFFQRRMMGHRRIVHKNKQLAGDVDGRGRVGRGRMAGFF